MNRQLGKFVAPLQPRRFPTQRGEAGETGSSHSLSSPPTSRPVQSPEWDEVLVVDPRSGLTPAQMVELKLRSALRGDSLPVSYVGRPIERKRND